MESKINKMAGPQGKDKSSDFLASRQGAGDAATLRLNDGQISRLTLRRPDDWHLHLREEALLRAVLPFSATQFGRALIMPNLTEPLIDIARISAYRSQIMALLPPESKFTPLMTLYLTDETKPDEIRRCMESGIVLAAKLYPAHATTLSQFGVTRIENIYPALEQMEKSGMSLCIHGETVRRDVDIFDREKIFIEETLSPLCDRFAGLNITLEHITSREAVNFVHAQYQRRGRFGASITPHHLMIDRNALFDGGLRPHYYCLPVAKRAHDRQALRQAAISGEACFFLGTDSAPHPRGAKESDCGCAGIFCAPHCLSLLAHIFETEHALDRLEGFTSLHGAAHYGLAPSNETITLERGAENIVSPAIVESAAGPIVIFDPQIALKWQ